VLIIPMVFVVQANDPRSHFTSSLHVHLLQSRPVHMIRVLTHCIIALKAHMNIVKKDMNTKMIYNLQLSRRGVSVFFLLISIYVLSFQLFYIFIFLL
jgi:ribosomal protein S15P/S13E